MKFVDIKKRSQKKLSPTLLEGKWRWSASGKLEEMAAGKEVKKLRVRSGSLVPQQEARNRTC